MLQLKLLFYVVKILLSSCIIYLYRIMVEDFKKFCSIFSCSNCTIINNIFLYAIYHILRYKQTVSGLEQHSSFIRKQPLEAYKFLIQSTCTRYSHQLWALSSDNINSGLKFHVQKGMVAYKSWIQKLPTFLLHRSDLSQRAYMVIVLVSRKQKSRTGGTSTLSNEKGHFGSTIWNDQTGQSGPPSKLVLNNPVGPNWNGSFNMLCQQKFPEFWVEWKVSFVFIFIHFELLWLMSFQN